MGELLAYGTLLQEGHPFELADKMLNEEPSRIDMQFKSEDRNKKFALLIALVMLLNLLHLTPCFQSMALVSIMDMLWLCQIR